MLTARIREEHGVVMIISVFFLAFAVVPLLVFVVDVGNWWVHKRHLQLQVDAAALAGGDQFGECFSNGGGPLPNGQTTTDMKNQADKYAGVAPGSFNGQVGGANQGSLSVLYNSPRYTNDEADPEYGTPAFPATSQSDPNPFCTSQVFDVKSTETKLPLFFNVIPNLSVVPAINRHARVQLYQVRIAKKSLPLAIPDTSPSNVFVTLWNLTSGSKIGDYALSGPASSGSPNYLNKWTGSVPLSMPSGNSEIGIRVGVGNTGPPGPSCFGTSGVNGSYQCYDQSTSTPLVVIRGYDSSANPSFPTPILRGVTETTCADPDTGSFSPFFSADVCSTPVGATVTANVSLPSCPNGLTCIFSIKGSDGNNTQTLTAPNCGAGCYSLSGFSYPGADGQEPMTLSWSYAGSPSSKCGKNGQPVCSANGTFLPSTPGYHQQAYSADSDLDVTGPVKAVSVSPGYTFAGGTSTTLTVTVGLETNLKSLPIPSPTTVMRVYTGISNRSSVVDCDGKGNSGVKDAFQFGCQTPYQINPTQSCNPDPAPAGPADCVQVKTGNLGQSIMNALDARFGCTTVNWPSFPVNPPDVRIVQVMITDTSALFGNQGAGKVPVTNFATFYVTGWARYTSGWKQSCNKNDPVPAGLSAKRGAVAMWGHYIKFVPGLGDTPGPTTCLSPGNNVIPCLPVLVR